jgi:hypothetical protein
MLNKAILPSEPMSTGTLGGAIVWVNSNIVWPTMWLPDLTGRDPVRYLAVVEALADAIAAGTRAHLGRALARLAAAGIVWNTGAPRATRARSPTVANRSARR